MAKNNDYEKRLQETYERFRRNEIKAKDIEPSMLFRINRMVNEELEEKMRLMDEIIRLVRETHKK